MPNAGAGRIKRYQMILSDLENNVNKGDTENRKFFRGHKISEHFFLAQFAFVSVTYCAAGSGPGWPVPEIGSQQESCHKLMFLSLVPN